MDNAFPSQLLDKAVSEFSKLPGVGRKTALRLVLHLLRCPESDTENFASALLRKGDYEGSMKYAKLAGMGSIYNKAFEGYRMEFLKKHFGAIFAVAAAVIIALLALGVAMKKRRRALAAEAAVPADADIATLDLNKGEAAEALQALEAEAKADEEAARLKAEIAAGKTAPEAKNEEREEEQHDDGPETR